MNAAYIISGMATAIIAMAGFIHWLVRILIKVLKDSTQAQIELKASIDNNTNVSNKMFDYMVKR